MIDTDNGAVSRRKVTYDIFGNEIRAPLKTDEYQIDRLVGRLLLMFTFADSWDNPRIDRKELKEAGYSDNEITSARRKALVIWPYIRFYFNARDKIDYELYDVMKAHREEVKHLKELDSILLARYQKLQKFTLTLIAARSIE